MGGARIVNKGGSLRYEYRIADHQGNTRAVYTDRDGNAELLQEEAYYPFGMRIPSMSKSYSGCSDDRYLYNGKELEGRLSGFHFSDYGARFYDAALGRFHTQDRFAEKYTGLTPYHYCAGNPIRYIDVNGDSINVTMVQRYDAENNTNFLSTIMNDLNTITGLTYSVTATGQLEYDKDGNGKPIISKDKNGNKMGSEEGRDIMTSAISSTDQVFTRLVTKPSSAIKGGSLINLNPSEIGSFVNGSVNVDNRTMGYGMTFMHEALHTKVGGSLDDITLSKRTIGEVATRLNIVRNQLNAQGYNFGQRLIYHGMLMSDKIHYIPFDHTSLKDINSQDIPSSSYIQY